MTLQEQFIMERRYLKSVTPATVIWYQQGFKRFEGAIGSRADAIERIGVLKDRGLSVVSINCHLRVVNAFWKWNGQDIRIPKLKEQETVLATLSQQAVDALLHFRAKGTNQIRAHLVALTILDTGLRASEVLGLTKENIDFDNLVFKCLGKGQKQRLVPFSIELRKALYRYSVRSGTGRLLFGTKNNSTVTVRNLERDFQALGKKAAITGVRFSPHTLRHTMATNWIRRGGDLFMLSRVLGHSDFKTTARYLKSLGVADIAPTAQRVSLLSATR